MRFGCKVQVFVDLAQSTFGNLSFIKSAFFLFDWSFCVKCLLSLVVTWNIDAQFDRLHEKLHDRIGKCVCR